MIDPNHLLTHIIRPVLKDLELWSPEAEKLVLGTACKESDCGQWLVQLGGGPARGIYQMEPTTERDIFDSYLRYKKELREKIDSYYLVFKWEPGEQMIGNLYYATAMCRVHYLRIPEPIPHDLPGQAAYWKQHYNTPCGAGTVDEYIYAWRRFVPAGVI